MREDGGHSSAGRASALQAEGRRFDPDWLQTIVYDLLNVYEREDEDSISRID